MNVLHVDYDALLCVVRATRATVREVLDQLSGDDGEGLGSHAVRGEEQGQPGLFEELQVGHGLGDVRKLLSGGDEAPSVVDAPGDESSRKQVYLPLDVE